MIDHKSTSREFRRLDALVQAKIAALGQRGLPVWRVTELQREIQRLTLERNAAWEKEVSHGR